MKRLRKRNQLILTLLAVMIVVAGYLTYLPKTENSVPVGGNQENSALMDISDEDVMAENIALEQSQYTGVTAETESSTAEAGENPDKNADKNTAKEEAGDKTAEESNKSAEQSSASSGDGSQPGEAVLTWSEQVENLMAEAQLGREQVRTRNEETLKGIIDNENLSEKQREAAADSLMLMTKNAGTEAAIESILETKGISNTLVTINDSGVEVLVGSSSITGAERAQIEDTVKREANVEISDVVISLMNEVNTEVVEEP